MDVKTMVEQEITGKGDALCAFSDGIFDNPELGFQEKKALARYTEFLKSEGFQVETGLDGMPTAFKATYGSGKPVIAYLAEYDALPELSQKAGCTSRCATDDANPNGHGCGHNLLGTGCLAAALGVKAYLMQHPGEGTVVLYGCPSEEKGNSKTFLARDGYFKDVDIAYSWHPFDKSEVAGYSMLANVSVFFRFKGVSAHAAAAPFMGRSALDAAELMNVGANFLREHIIPEARIHYAFRDVGGIAPNVVQPTSCVHYMIRAPRNSQVQEIYARVIDIAKGAALMTGTTMEYELYAGLSDLLPNHVVSENMQKALEAVGMPHFTEEDKQWARNFFESCCTPEELQKKEAQLTRKFGKDKLQFPVDNVIKPIDWSAPPMSGSSDVGDASQVVPVAFLSMATSVFGTAAHTWQMTAQGKGPIAHKMMLQAGKVLALSGIDMLQHPELIAAAKKELQEETGGKYLCPIPADIKPRLND